MEADPWEELRKSPDLDCDEHSPTLRSIVELASDSMSLSAAIWKLQPDGETLAIVTGTGLTRRYLDEVQSAGGRWELALRGA